MSVTASMVCYEKKGSGEKIEKGGEVVSILFFAKTIYMLAVKRYFIGGKPAFKFPDIAIRRERATDSN